MIKYVRITYSSFGSRQEIITTEDQVVHFVNKLDADPNIDMVHQEPVE